MNDYYEKRTKQKSINGYFQYKRPNITIDDIRPYTYIVFDQIRNKQSLSLVAEVCSDYDEESLKNISLTLNGNTFDISSMNYLYQFDNGLKSIKNFSISASNVNDVYGRRGFAEKSFEISEDLTSLLSLPMDGNDYFTDDVTKVFEIIPSTNDEQNSNETVDWLWVKQNTLHDVIKTHSFGDGRFFGSEDCNNFIFDGNQIRHAIYDVITLSDGVNTYRRFVPYKGDTSVDVLGQPKELQTADDIVVSEHSIKYQKLTDKGTINVNILNNSDIDLFGDISKIKNMFLELKKDNELVSRYDVKGLRNLYIEDLPFGQYSYSFIINSEYNKTIENKTKTYDVFLNVKPNDCVFFLGSPTITSAKDNKKFIGWKWEINHKDADEIIFVYDAKSNGEIIKSEKFPHAKIQYEYQSTALPLGTTVDYYFLVKSSVLDMTSEDLELYEDSSGKTYVVVNKNSIQLS